MRVTLVLGRLRVVRVVVASPSSGSRVLGGREFGFRLDDSEDSGVLDGVRSGLMSVVTGGLVLVIVAVVVDAEDLDAVDVYAGPT